MVECSTMRNFDMNSYSRQLSRIFSGLDFNYESMEEELTCPVCLELYADPLLLPCSHSVCKKCLQDIIHSVASRGNKQMVECPSCRKEVPVTKDILTNMPRNLALENVVIRYTEERSKSIRKSLSLESPISDLLLSPISDETELPEFPLASKANCELCETQCPSKAAWYCLQCEVAYCHSCFGKFHPRRGALARHKVRQPLEDEEESKPTYCSDHQLEVASIFCDACKVFVCQLCVCDGEGKHAGHKILAPDTASKKIKEIVEYTQKESQEVQTILGEQRTKIEGLSDRLQHLHKEACRKLEQQYTRLVEDMTAALRLEKDRILQEAASGKEAREAQIQSFMEESATCRQSLQDISASTAALLGEKSARAVLDKAVNVQPLVTSLKKCKTVSETMSAKYESLLKDKTYKTELQSSLDSFRKRSVNLMQILIGEPEDSFETVVPVIQSPTSPGKSNISTRVQNKCLITWGFSSTTFTGEPLRKNCTFVVTVERNGGHAGYFNSGYLFGVGVAAEPLNVKDSVGMSPNSHGVICTGGALCFAHNGKKDHLTALDNLPLSLTVSVNLDHPDYVILTYILSGSSDGHGGTLVGKRVINNKLLKSCLHPVFTASQRIKILFPTCV